MSLIDIAAELEYVPQDQLVQFMSDPNSRYPEYLVLSEIQRRTQMKQMYDNQMARQNQPSTTVAEEAVMELSQGAMPSSAEVSSPLDAGITSMAPPSPQMGMASGGLTAFANGGTTSTQRNFLISLGIDADTIGKMSDEQINQTVEKIRAGAVKAPEEKKNVFENIASGISGGLDYIGVPDLGISEFFFGDKFGDEAMDYVSLVPAGGLGAQVVKRGVLPAAKATKRFFQPPKGGGGVHTTNIPPTSGLSGAVDDAAAFGGPGFRWLRDQAVPWVIDNPVTTGGLLTSPWWLSEGFENIFGEDDAAQVVNTTQSGDNNINNKISDNDPRGNQAGTGSRTNVAIDSLMSSIGNLPTVDVPEFTEADKQRELDVYALGSLAKAFGSAKNLGDAATAIGDAAMGLPAIKESQRKRSLESASAQRQQAVESFNLTLAVEKLRTLAEQAINSRDSNLISIVNSFEKKLLEASSNPFGVDEAEIEKIKQQIDYLLKQSSFGIDTTPTRIKIPDQ